MKTFARERDRTEILRRLRRVRCDSAPRWGKMTAHQMICHLSDACRMSTGEKAVSEADGRLPKVLVKWVVLYLPLPWPTGIQTRPELDQSCGGTRPAEFAADLAALERLLEEIGNRGAAAEWPRHPIFGRMSHKAWMRWAYLHADHHLRQFNA